MFVVGMGNEYIMSNTSIVVPSTHSSSIKVFDNLDFKLEDNWDNYYEARQKHKLTHEVIVRGYGWSPEEPQHFATKFSDGIRCAKSRPEIWKVEQRYRLEEGLEFPEGYENTEEYQKGVAVVLASLADKQKECEHL
jgi:hypothetical protein